LFDFRFLQQYLPKDGVIGQQLVDS
jgi:hypothetical protein